MIISRIVLGFSTLRAMWWAAETELGAIQGVSKVFGARGALVRQLEPRPVLGGVFWGAPHRWCPDAVSETDAEHSSWVLGVLHTGASWKGVWI